MRLLLSKRIAELAGVSDDEIASMIKLPTIKRQQTAPQRQARTTVSIQRRFLLMLLMRPDLASTQDLDWAKGTLDEDRLLRLAIETALAYPSSKPAALLHQMQAQADAKLMREIERELHLLDDSLDIELEFNGARTQLLEMHQQRERAHLFDRIGEKSLSELTDEEKAVLKSMVNAPKNSM